MGLFKKSNKKTCEKTSKPLVNTPEKGVVKELSKKEKKATKAKSKVI